MKLAYDEWLHFGFGLFILVVGFLGVGALLLHIFNLWKGLCYGLPL